MKKIACLVLFVSACLMVSAQTTLQLLQSEMDKGIIHPSVVANASVIDTSQKINVAMKENNNAYIINSDAFHLSIGKNPFSISLVNNITKEQWQLDSVLFDGKNNLLKTVSVHLNKNDLIVTTNKTNVSFKLKIITKNMIEFSVMNDDENVKNIELKFKGGGSFFGGGERFVSSNLNGRTFTNQPHDHAWLPDTLRTAVALQRFEPSYISIPFVYTPKGNGLYIDDINTDTIDLSNADKNNFSININHNKTTVYFFIAASPKEVLTSYTSLIGRTPLLPDWAFGVWINLLKGEDSVIDRANELRSLNIPSDVLWLFDFDDPESNTGWTLWTNGYYGDLRGLTDTLHKLNFKVVTYMRPYVNRNLSYYNYANPVYTFAKANNLILPNIPVNEDTFSNFHSNDQVNFFNDKAADWWKSMIKRSLVDKNIDGWMEDFGDVSYVYHKQKLYYTPLQYTTGKPFGNLTPEQVANIYPLIYHKTTHLAAAAFKPDVVEFSRSSSVGAASYQPVIWGGDQEPTWSKTYGYPSSITAGLSAGLSGYSVWAPDILCLSPSRQLWMRWVEFGAMTPIMRDHLWDYAPNNIRIWTDSSTKQFFKKYAIIHEALKDYLHECAKQATQTGVPIMRHLMLEYPNDTTTFHLEYEYMLGSDILVAPVLEENAVSENVYLPAGKWKYYWTNKIYEGSKFVNVDASFSEIPFFIKEDKANDFVLPKP